MCVDSLLLKLNSDEKQPTRLFISVFTSGCIFSPTNGGCPLYVGIGLTINLMGNPMLFSHEYLTHMLFGFSTHLHHHFQVIEYDVSVETPIVYDCSCDVILVSSHVLC